MLKLTERIRIDVLTLGGFLIALFGIIIAASDITVVMVAGYALSLAGGVIVGTAAVRARLAEERVKRLISPAYPYTNAIAWEALQAVHFYLDEGKSRSLH